jgi:TonB-linked SusC/RagA family outer membrane protein
MDTQAITVGASNMINVTLKSNTELDEVVITALNISKEKKKLGYASTTVKSEDLEQRTESDLARILQGKAPGVNIQNASGISGGATSIQIRTPTSITSSNQPLYIIDGIPIDNSVSATDSFVNGNAGSSRQVDIDPNNIENVEILRGFAAANLYGVQGKNGVIMITTKTGKLRGKGAKKNEFTVSQGVFFNEVASLPDYTQKYGNGFDFDFGNFYSNWGPGFYQDGPGGWGSTTTINPNGTIQHPYDRGTVAPHFPEFAGQTLAWKPYNQVKDVFRVGLVTNTSIGVNGSSSDGNFSYALSYGKLEDEGFVPGNKMSRDNFSVGGMGKLSNKFTVQGSINVSRSKFRTPPIAYSSGSSVASTAGLSFLSNLLFTPTNLPIMDLPFQSPLDGSNIWYNDPITNPRWTLANSWIADVTDRAITAFNINYDINSNLKLNYRVGFDIYNTNKEENTNKGASELSRRNGYLLTQSDRSETWDHNFSIFGNYKLTEKLGLNFISGVTTRNQKSDLNRVIGQDQGIFGIAKQWNFSSFQGQQFTYERNILGVYTQADFDYNDYLTLTLSARKDWVSNFINNSAFYPSASASFLPFNAFNVKSNYFNFLKIRLAYGSSAGFGDFGRYPMANTGSQDTQYFVYGTGLMTSHAYNGLAGNPGLKPEISIERELGIEGKLLNNRISFELSAYERDTKDLILNASLPNSTGFTSTFKNLGSTYGYGFEGDIKIKAIKNDDTGFNWETGLNYDKTRVTVTSIGLDDTPDARIIYGGFSNLGNAAIKDMPFFTIVGSTIARTADGQPIIASNGSYLIDESIKPIGDAMPDFRLGYSNTFSYKNFTLSALVTYQHGGDMVSNTISTMLGRGVTTDTDNRLSTYILPGVVQTGVNGNGQPLYAPNTNQINASQYYFSNLFAGPSELSVWDASHFRLQEISLGYSIPAKMLEKLPFGSISFTFSGNNLWYRAINTPKGVNFDPNVSGTGVGNARGFDFLNSMSGRRYGFSLRLTF